MPLLSTYITVLFRIVVLPSRTRQTRVITSQNRLQPTEQKIRSSLFRQRQCFWPHLLFDCHWIVDPFVQPRISIGVDQKSFFVIPIENATLDGSESEIVLYSKEQLPPGVFFTIKIPVNVNL